MSNATVAFEAISVDHGIMGGVPCIRGTRIPVATVIGMLADGVPADEIVADYPQLTLDDVPAALRYAAAAVDERELLAEMATFQWAGIGARSRPS